ncbi:MAG: DnaA/Hda family protein [Planctomycetota bacterium]
MKTATNQSPADSGTGTDSTPEYQIRRQHKQTDEQNPTELTSLIRTGLINRIGEPRFELWFDHPDCIRIEARSVVITASSDFAVQRLQNSFAADIRYVVSRVCGESYSCRFSADETELESSDVEPADSGSTISIEGYRQKESVPVAPSRRQVSLNSFCFGKENQLASASADQVMRHPGKFSPLYVFGPTGSGKTHFLEGLATDFRRSTGKARCVYLSAEEFTATFVASLRGAGLPMFRRKYRDLDFLAIDDVQFFAGKRATLGEFQSTVDNLLRLGKQVVVSSDRPPAELTGIAPELSARLSGGLICPLDYPELEGRIGICNTICRDRGFNFSPEVIELVAEKVCGDVRKLSGALNRLHAASVVSGSSVSVAMTSEVLVDLFALAGAMTSLSRIEKAVCDLCQIRPAELKSSSRKKRICTARMLAMYLAREHTTNAYSEIGDYFGGRSHSTVIAARKKVENWIEKEQRIDLPNAAYEVADVVKRIKSSLRVG